MEFLSNAAKNKSRSPARCYKDCTARAKNRKQGRAETIWGKLVEAVGQSHKVTLLLVCVTCNSDEVIIVDICRGNK